MGIYYPTRVPKGWNTMDKVWQTDATKGIYVNLLFADGTIDNTTVEYGRVFTLQDYHYYRTALAWQYAKPFAEMMTEEIEQRYQTKQNQKPVVFKTTRPE